VRGTRFCFLDGLGALDLAREVYKRGWLKRDLFSGILSLTR
jgi:hypothetical protein